MDNKLTTKKYLVIFNHNGEYVKYSEKDGFSYTPDINQAHHFTSVEVYEKMNDIFTVIDIEDFEDFSRLSEDELVKFTHED